MERLPLGSPSRRKLAALAAGGALLAAAGCSGGEAHVEASPKAKPSATAESTPTHPRTQKMAKHVIFASNRSGGYDIYDKNLETGKIVDLTPNSPGDDMNPEPSPDGKKIVFYSGSPSQIYTESLANPADVKQLTSSATPKYDPTYMGNNHILFKVDPGNGKGNIWEMASNGTQAHNLTPSMSDSEQYKPAAIDKTHISFTDRATSGQPNSDELYTEDITTGEITRRTHNKVPDWYSSIASGRTFFVSKEWPHGPDAIFESPNADITTRKVVVGGKDLPGDNDDPSISRNGEQVVFVNDAAGNYNLESKNLVTGVIHELDHSPGTSNDLGPFEILELDNAA